MVLILAGAEFQEEDRGAPGVGVVARDKVPGQPRAAVDPSVSAQPLL